MTPDVFDVRTRTILPERQNRDRRGHRTIPRTRVDVRRGGRDARPKANTSNRTSFPPVSARGGPGDGHADGRGPRARPSGPGPDAAGGPGDLVRLLRSGGGDVSRPVVVQAGAEEDQIVVHARRYRDALLARGAKMGYREIRGGHDYAWWRHGILDALVELGDGGH